PLTWWASGLACGRLGWVKKIDARKATPEELAMNKTERFRAAQDMLTKITRMEPEEYVSLLDSAYRAHAEKLETAADQGTDMHAELEKYVTICLKNHQGKPFHPQAEVLPQVEIFARWSVENVERFIVSEGHCFSEDLWTGGISDLLFEDKKGRLAIMDFKSSKEAYLSQFFQIAGYDIAISENGLFTDNGEPLFKMEPERSIAYYAVFPFGMENPAPQFHFDTFGARMGFRAAVTLYKLINNN
ncbi:MAG: hypothetical protein ACREO5_00180, partial [Candidatus Binatia bacterium]